MLIRSSTIAADGLGYPEGPVALPDGRVAFVEQYRSRVSILQDGRVVSLAVTGGNPNGLAVDAGGSVWATRGRGVLGEWTAEQRVAPGIIVIEPETGHVEVVTTTADGEPLRAPNDLCFGPDGALWFTDPDDYDPDAGIRGWICRLEHGSASRVAVLENTFPNGLAFDAAGTLYWVESIARRVSRWTSAGPQVVASLPGDAIPDGCAFTADGRLVVATLHSGAIDVVSVADANPGVERITMPDGVALTNLAFQGSVLWATDVSTTWIRHADPTGRLWRFDTDAVGLPLHAGDHR